MPCAGREELETVLGGDQVLMPSSVRSLAPPVPSLQVGDRLDTDIMFGKNGGLTTALVLSGERCTGRAQGIWGL